MSSHSSRSAIWAEDRPAGKRTLRLGRGEMGKEDPPVSASAGQPPAAPSSDHLDHRILPRRADFGRIRWRCFG